jgi:hypothetical protein
MRSHARKILTFSAVAAAVLAVGAAGSAAPASAFAIGQCTGASIGAEGGGLQAEAEKLWTERFNVTANPDACNGTQGGFGTPTVSYTPTGGKPAAKAWEKKEQFGAFPFISKGFPPSTATIAKLIGVKKHPARAGTFLTIPLAQTAIAVVMHLPTGCTATSTPSSGRLVLGDSTLEAVLRGTTSTWSAIKDSGDTLSGGSCNAATTITRVVPKEPADPEAIVKKLLFHIDSGAVYQGTKTWFEIAEVAKWPEEAVHKVKKELNVAGYVAAHPGTIGIAWVHFARPQFGAPGHGAGSELFWAEVQNGTSGGEPTYADPSSNGDQEADANSNCRETEYANEGKALPEVGESWNAVSATLEEPHYALCGLSYAFALSSYSAYSGAAVPPSEEQARTVRDFLHWIVNIEPEGGQPVIGAAGTDYGKLPPAIFNIARPGTELIDF